MKEKILSINVSNYDNPRKLIKELEGKYPDQNVKILLNNEKGELEVMVNPDLPLQLKIDIGSFLSRQIQLKVNEEVKWN